MRTIQIVALTHRPAPPGMVAEPIATTSINPPWSQIESTICAMDDDRFMVLLSARADIDAAEDQDALAIEFGEGFGFTLYQLGFAKGAASTAWRSRSADHVTIPGITEIDIVLRIAAAFSRGASFNEISLNFSGV